MTAGEVNTFQRVVICGLGGTGLPALTGLLRLTHLPPLDLLLIDPDSVSLSNLQRQFLFSDKDIGREKAPTAADRIRNLCKTDPARIRFSSRVEAVTEHNIAELFSGAALVIDTTDSSRTKLLVNDYCVAHRINLCSTGVVADRGQALFLEFRNSRTPACLRCLFDQLEDRDFLEHERACQSAGIFGPAAGLVGLLAANLSAGYLSRSPCGGNNEANGEEDTANGDRNGSPFLRASLNAPSPRESWAPPSPSCPLGCAEPRVVIADLRDLECPSTFLYTKLALERIEENTALDVRFRTEESTQRVTASCEELGFSVLSRGRRIAHDEWRLLLRGGAR